jgi:succinate dehydrogenase / fumarate reductase, cytochrome b subunit
MVEKKRVDNHLGLKGWVFGGRWGAERYLFTLHRITGLGLLLYFFLHILVTTSRVFGKNAWEVWMGSLQSPVFKIGEFLVFAGFVFHAVNGIRLILLELGLAVGKAEVPIYPYSSSINTQRPLMVMAMIVAVILILTGGYEFMGLSR